MKRRIISIALVFILILSLAPTAFAAGFSDTGTNWAKDIIDKWALEYEILNGDPGGTFRPDDPIKRGEFAAVLNRVMKYQTTAKNVFTDLNSGAFYYDDILKLYAAGVMNGTSATTIAGEANIKREEAFAMLARMFSIPGNTAALSKFSDASSVSSWARSEVGGMVAAGYIQGSGGMLYPQDNLTRAQAVQALDNIIKGIYSKAGTYSIDTDEVVVVNAHGVVLNKSEIGALYVTPGIGKTGDFTLQSSEVDEMVVMGGGVNSISLKASKVINLKVIVDSTNGDVRIHYDKDSEIGYVDIQSTTEIVYITGEGDLGTIYVDDGATVIVSGDIDALNIVGDNVTVIVEEGSTVKTMTVTGEDAEIEIEGTVTTLNISGSGAEVDVSGTVGDVTISTGSTLIEGDGTITGKVTVTAGAGSGNKITVEGATVENKSSYNVGLDGSRVLAPGATGVVGEGYTKAAVSTIPGVTATPSNVTENSQTIAVSGRVLYYDNKFTGSLATDFSSVLTGTPDKRPDISKLEGKFTYLSITNFKALLGQAGVTSGSFTVVETNPALEIYKTETNVTDSSPYIKTTTYAYSSFSNPYNMLVTGSGATVKVYAGSSASGTPVLTLTISAALTFGGTSVTDPSFCVQTPTGAVWEYYNTLDDAITQAEANTNGYKTVRAMKDVTISAATTIPAGVTLLVPGEYSLTINNTLTVTGALDVRGGSTGKAFTVKSGKTLTVNGNLKIGRSVILEAGSTLNGSGTITATEGAVINGTGGDSGVLSIPSNKITGMAFVEYELANSTTPTGNIAVKRVNGTAVANSPIGVVQAKSTPDGNVLIVVPTTVPTTTPATAKITKFMFEDGSRADIGLEYTVSGSTCTRTANAYVKNAQTFVMAVNGQPDSVGIDFIDLIDTVILTADITFDDTYIDSAYFGIMGSGAEINNAPASRNLTIDGGTSLHSIGFGLDIGKDAKVTLKNIEMDFEAKANMVALPDEIAAIAIAGENAEATLNNVDISITVAVDNGDNAVYGVYISNKIKRVTVTKCTIVNSGKSTDDVYCIWTSKLMACSISDNTLEAKTPLGIGDLDTTDNVTKDQLGFNTYTSKNDNKRDVLIVATSGFISKENNLGTGGGNLTNGKIVYYSAQVKSLVPLFKTGNLLRVYQTGDGLAASFLKGANEDVWGGVQNLEGFDS